MISRMRPSSGSISEPTCPIHAGESTRLFCEDCNKLVCLKCQHSPSCRNHRVQLVEQAREAKLPLITQLNSQLMINLQEIQTQERRYDLQLAELDTYLRNSNQTVQATFQQIRNMINAQEQLILSELQTEVTSAQTPLRASKTKSATMVSELIDQQRCGNDLLQQSPERFMTSFPKFNQNCTRLAAELRQQQSNVAIGTARAVKSIDISMVQSEISKLGIPNPFQMPPQPMPQPMPQPPPQPSPNPHHYPMPQPAPQPMQQPPPYVPQPVPQPAPPYQPTKAEKKKTWPFKKKEETKEVSCGNCQASLTVGVGHQQVICGQCRAVNNVHAEVNAPTMRMECGACNGHVLVAQGSKTFVCHLCNMVNKVAQ
jgi:hypothetical protein